jgi:hypothetical protein
LAGFFSAPTQDNRKIDIVIAVTPRVIRAPAILPEDEVERPTGSIATPTSGSLEAMVLEEDRQDLLAVARRVPNSAKVQLPDRPPEAPAYVRTGSSPPDTANAKVDSGNGQGLPAAISNLRPIDSNVKTLQVSETSDNSSQASGSDSAAYIPEPPSVELRLPTSFADMKAGDKAKIPVLVNSSTGFKSATVGLNFDSAKLAVRSVTFGDVFGAALAGSKAAPFVNDNGKMYVTLSLPDGVAPLQVGVLAFVEVEALADGKPSIVPDKDIASFLTLDGKNFTLKF